MQRIAQSPTDPAFVQDPYPHYDRMRALGPIVYWEDYAMPCAVSHAAVGAILRDRRMGREVPPEAQTPVPEHQRPFYAVEDHSMLELEPPRHTRLRGLVLRAFTSRRIAALAPEITALADALIDRLPAGEVDLLRHFAQPIPVIVIARLLGVPEGMKDQLLAWSTAMVGMYQAGRTHADEVAAATAAQEFGDFLRDYVAERRAKPADDLITHLIAAEADGEKLGTDELITTCILLLNAGHEATVHSMGNGIKALLETGWWRAAADPEMSAPLVEEILRFDPPLHLFIRHVYDDTEVMGHRFRRGDRVACLLGAANRDPGPWEDPARFDPHRSSTAHHAFGAGIHFCVGAPLARLELQIALQRLSARHPDLQLAGTPRYGDTYHFHGLAALPVRL